MAYDPILSSYAFSSSFTTLVGIGGRPIRMNMHEVTNLMRLGFYFDQSNLTRLTDLATDLDYVGKAIQTRASEGVTALWIEEQYGIRLQRYFGSMEGGRYVEKYGDWINIDPLTREVRTYDALRGYSGPPENFSFNQTEFERALWGHNKSGLDYIVIDVTGLNPNEIPNVQIVAERIVSSWPYPRPAIIWQM